MFGKLMKDMVLSYVNGNCVITINGNYILPAVNLKSSQATLSNHIIVQLEDAIAEYETFHSEAGRS